MRCIETNCPTGNRSHSEFLVLLKHFARLLNVNRRRKIYFWKAAEYIYRIAEYELDNSN